MKVAGVSHIVNVHRFFYTVDSWGSTANPQTTDNVGDLYRGRVLGLDVGYTWTA